MYRHCGLCTFLAESASCVPSPRCRAYAVGAAFVYYSVKRLYAAAQSRKAQQKVKARQAKARANVAR